VHIISDGCEHVVGSIPVSNGVSLRSEPRGDAELLSLAQARLLTWSSQTFSRWAAAAKATPILNVADDVDEIAHETVIAS
jgi:hypothetical protein